MSNYWDFIVLYRHDSLFLDSLSIELFNKINPLKLNGNLNDFYISLEYTRDAFELGYIKDRSENHLRIGLKIPYNGEKINSIFRDLGKGFIKIEHSPELDEIENIKALATQLKNISEENLGKTGKLAHLIHHYLTQNGMDLVKDRKEAINEGRNLLKKYPTLYNQIIMYLGDAYYYIIELYNQLNTANNEQHPRL